MQTADTVWAEMEPKRDSVKARQIARLNHMRIHMEFDNWLITIEASRRREPQSQGHVDHILRRDQSGQSPYQQFQEGVKRAFPGSPTSQHTEDRSPSYEFGSKEPHEQQSVLPIFPTSTRLRRTSSIPSLKRLKFSDSVEFRDNYRDSSEYLRTDKKYVRGRYACLGGSEYLDTSGSAQSFLKFTGVKRVKDHWVEVTEADTASKRKGRKAAEEGTPDDAGALAGPADDVPHKINEEEAVTPDRRSLRLARRTGSSSGTNVSHRRSSAGPTKEDLHQKMAIVSLSRPLKPLGEPPGDLTASFSAPRSGEKHPELAGRHSNEAYKPLSEGHLLSRNDVSLERWRTGVATNKQTPKTRDRYHSPEEGYQDSVVPRRSGTDNGYAGVVASDQQRSLGAKAVEHTFTQPLLSDEAHHVQTEPLTRIGEVPTSLRVRHSVLCPGSRDLTQSQAEHPDATQTEGQIRKLEIAIEGSGDNLQELVTTGHNVSEVDQNGVLDETEGIADPQSPSDATVLSVPYYPITAAETATVKQATLPLATLEQNTLHAQNPSLHDPAAIASHLHSPTA
ncbi:hypothetical protein NX059_005544 [Plenodomus lindquistii]|nr:hypothetical protein NX059_005544 [Plenodomus lindquistii]